METAFVRILEEHLDLVMGHGELENKIREHLEETRVHAEKIGNALKRLGGKVSRFKSGVARYLGMLESKKPFSIHDRLIKNIILEYVAEHLEIASYEVLIATARETGDGEIIRICEAILESEKKMATWLKERLLIAVKEYCEKHK